MESLPTDLLAYALEFVALGPRLRVLSRVSKRWRALVIRTIKRFPVRDARVHTLLTSLEHAVVDYSWKEGVRLPPSVTSVYLVCPRLSSSSCVCAEALPLPCLRRLGATVKPESKCYAQVAERHRTSLVSLTLAHAGETPDPAFGPLLSAVYPRLTAVALPAVPRAAERLGPFVAAHPSVTRLSLSPIEWGAHDKAFEELLALLASPASFPQLRSLTVHARYHLRATERVVRAHTALEQLRLTGVEVESEDAVPLLTAGAHVLQLVTLEGDWPQLHSELSATLDRCTSLTALTLRLRRRSVPSYRDWLTPALCSRLRYLTPDPRLADLALFPHLVSWSADASEADAFLRLCTSAQPPQALRSLSQLELDLTNLSPFGTAVASALRTAVLPATPHMTSLRLTLAEVIRGDDEAHKAELAQLLDLLVAHSAVRHFGLEYAAERTAGGEKRDSYAVCNQLEAWARTRQPWIDLGVSASTRPSAAPVGAPVRAIVANTCT